MEKTFEEEIQDRIRDRIECSGFFNCRVVLFKINEKTGIFYILAEAEYCVSVIDKGKYVVSGDSIFIELSSGEKFYI